MKYILYGFCILINLGFALNGDAINILVIGLIAGFAIASALEDFLV